MPFVPGIIIGLLVGITVHEASHAWMANFLGDPTAKIEGRVSLNPMVHLDPLGTLMIFITFLAGVGFGWGKPVPYNPYNLKNPRIGALWIAVAGPLANLITAFVFVVIFKTLNAYPLFLASALGGFVFQVVFMIILINIGLMAFNLLPIPPLDGSKVLAAVVPERYNYELQTFFHYGPFILIGLIVFDSFFKVNILGQLIGPIVDGTLFVFDLVM